MNFTSQIKSIAFATSLTFLVKSFNNIMYTSPADEYTKQQQASINDYHNQKIIIDFHKDKKEKKYDYKYENDKKEKKYDNKYENYDNCFCCYPHYKSFYFYHHNCVHNNNSRTYFDYDDTEYQKDYDISNYRLMLLGL